MKGNMYCSSSCSNLGWAFIKFKEQQAFSYPKDHIGKSGTYEIQINLIIYEI